MKTSRKPKNIKLHNEKLILRLLSDNIYLTASEISHRANLSITTVMKLLDSMRQSKAIISLGKGESTEEGGKRPELFALNPDYMYSFGCGVTRDLVTVVLMDFDRKVRNEKQRHYDAAKGYESFIDAMCLCIYEIIKENELAFDQICGLSIGVDGVVDVEQGILRYPITYNEWGTNLPVKESVKKALPEIKNVLIDNSGRLCACTLLLEHPEYKDTKTFCIISGEHSVGCLFDHEKIKRGANGFLGEIGHLHVDTNFKHYKCCCGSSGCFESLVSPKGILYWVKEFGSEFPGNELYQDLCENRLGYEKVLEAANRKDPLAIKVIEKMAGYFAQIIRSIVLSCDPETIVLCGIYEKGNPIFNEILHRQIADTAFFNIDELTSIEWVKGFNNNNVHIGASYYAIYDYLENTQTI